MSKRILVPLDLTSEMEAVLPLVADAARGSGATVRLLHVSPHPEQIVDLDGRVIAYTDQETARLESEAMDHLRVAELVFDGVAVESAVRFGETVPEILLAAEDFDADLIALSTRCTHRLSRLVLSTAADEICRRTDIAVMVFRPRRDGGAW